MDQRNGSEETGFRRLKRFVIGKARDVSDPEIFRHTSLIAFLAWVGLGADGLSSSAYGPDEAYRALGSHTHLAIILAAITTVTIVVISTAYANLIEYFPGGGGGYLVATKLLGNRVGVVSGCAGESDGRGLPQRRQPAEPDRGPAVLAAQPARVLVRLKKRHEA